MIHSISESPTGQDDLKYRMNLAGQKGNRKIEKRRLYLCNFIEALRKKNGSNSQKSNKWQEVDSREV